MSRFSAAFPILSQKLKTQIWEHRHILLGVFSLAVSIFFAGTQTISAQTNDVDTIGTSVKPMPSPSSDITTEKSSCTPRPACLDATPACNIAEQKDWCPASPTPSCSPRPLCLDAAKPCTIKEPASGWCPASPAPSTTPTTCAPDLNKDGFVDLIDYALFVPHFLQTNAKSTNDVAIVGDFNSDGIVDLLDYTEIVRMFLKSCGSATASIGSPKPIGSPSVEK
jgi:hypothetical protein